VRSLSQIYSDYFSSTAVFSYRQDERIFRTRFMRAWFTIFLILVAIIFTGSLFGIGANEYHYFIGNLILINLIAAIGLQLLVGFTGLLSLGHAAFLGVGAYTSALLITNFGCPFVLSILIAGLVASLLGLIVGIPSLRIKGFYLMVATLAFQFVIDYTIIHWESVTRGIRGIELPTPGLVGISLETNKAYFLFLFVLAVFLMWGGQEHYPLQDRPRPYRHSRQRCVRGDHRNIDLPLQASLLFHKRVLRGCGRGTFCRTAENGHPPGLYLPPFHPVSGHGIGRGHGKNGGDRLRCYFYYPRTRPSGSPCQLYRKCL